MNHPSNRSFILVILAFILILWPSPPAAWPSYQLPNPQLAKSSPVLSLGTDLNVKIGGQEGLLVYPGFPLRNSVKVAIANIGNKDAQNFDADVILSQNRDLTGKYELLSRVHVPLLKAHVSVELPFEKGFKIPDDASCKKLYLVALVDSGRTVTETNENNNAAALAVQVQMKITDVWQLSDGDDIELRGLGFGTTPGNKQVYLDGSPQGTNVYWSPARIVIGNTTDDLPLCQNYSVTIKQFGAAISNAVVIFMKCHLNYFNPKQGQGGTTVHIVGLGFGFAQGGKTLKIGTVPVSTIVSWAYHEIVCQIPAGLAPGQYFFSVWEDGKDVSLVDQQIWDYFTIL
jgi:hypothetical protein